MIDNYSLKDVKQQCNYVFRRERLRKHSYLNAMKYKLYFHYIDPQK